MNEQSLLFDIHAGTDAKPKSVSSIEALSHSGDPATSGEAAKQFQESGKLGLHQRTVLDGVRRCNGGTHSEIAALTPLDWLQVARRLSELARAGLIHRGGPRLCTIKHSRCSTWWVAPGGRL